MRVRLLLGDRLGLYYLSRRYAAIPDITCILLAGTYFGSSWPAVSHHVDKQLLCIVVRRMRDCLAGEAQAIVYCLRPVRWREPRPVSSAKVAVAACPVGVALD